MLKHTITITLDATVKDRAVVFVTLSRDWNENGSVGSGEFVPLSIGLDKAPQSTREIVRGAVLDIVRKALKDECGL